MLQQVSVASLRAGDRFGRSSCESLHRFARHDPKKREHVIAVRNGVEYEVPISEHGIVWLDQGPSVGVISRPYNPWQDPYYSERPDSYNR